MEAWSCRASIVKIQNVFLETSYTMRKKAITRFLFLLSLLGTGYVRAQLSLTSLSTTATMNFDIPGTSNCSGTLPWVDNVTIPNCYTNRSVYGYSNGCHNTGAVHVAGNNGETAFGGRASTSTPLILWGVRVANNTGQAITSLRISYRAEQWAAAQSNVTNTIRFEYQVSATPFTTVTSGTYTSVSALDMTNFTTAGGCGGGGNAIDGNAAANSAVLSACVQVNIPAGSEIMLRWYEPNDGCNDHMMCIDDLEVTPLSSIDAISNAPVCSGDTIKLTTTPKFTGGIYSWVGPNGFTSPAADTFITPARLTDTGYYKITTTVAGCGTWTDSVKVMVNPPFRDTLSDSICTGAAYTFNGKQYNTPGFYADTFKSIGGCDSVSVLNLKVKQTPQPPAVTDTIPYCQLHVPAPLTAVGANLLWYEESAGGSGSAIAPTPSTEAGGLYKYYVTQTVNGCESPRAEIAVKVTASLAKFTVQPDPLCAGDTATITFTGDAPGEAVYNWGWDGAVLYSGSGPGPYRVSWVIAGTYNVKLQVNNNGCISKVATVPVKVNALPQANITMLADACMNAPVTLKATGGITYIWEYGTAKAEDKTNAQSVKVSWNEAGKKEVAVVAIDQNGCSSEPEKESIIINALPDAGIATVLDGPVCVNDTLTLEGVPKTSYSYSWSSDAFTFDYPFERIVSTYIISRSSYAYLTVTDNNNCKATDSIWVDARPCCSVYMPNAFTPNQDGKNDVFRAITKAPQTVYDLRIFDRWGKQIFATMRYYDGWDGTVNGTPAAIGVYHYLLRFECDGREQYQKGEVTLIR